MRSIWSVRTIRTRHPLVAAVVLLVLSAGCSKKQEQRARPPVPVTVTRVQKMDVPYTIEANGVVVPLRSAAVASQVEGLIRRVAFNEGQDVVQGQVLFEVDSRPYRAAYQQAAANVQRSRANADNARAETQRYAALAQQDYVTREQADQQRANAAASSAQVAADQAALSTAKFNLDNATIRAPISGRTGGLLVKEGNLVHASGGAPLVVINQLSPILVRFAIPATQLPLLQKYGTNGKLAVTAIPNSGTDVVADSSASSIGLNVGGGDQRSSGQSRPTGGFAGSPAGGSSAGGGGSASGGGAGRGAGRPGASAGGTDDAGAGAGAGAGSGRGGRPGAPSSQLATLAQPENGILSFIDNAVDTTTGTVLLKASFPNPTKRLWAGEFVSTRLSLFVEQGALVVPTQAVVTGQTGAYVYVVSDSGTAKQRPVTVERTAGNLSVIASGLRAGESVVTDGQSRLTPNAKVSVMTPQGARAGGGGAGAAGRGAGAGRGGSGAGRAGAGAGSPAPSPQ